MNKNQNIAKAGLFTAKTRPPFGTFHPASKGTTDSATLKAKIHRQRTRWEDEVRIRFCIESGVAHIDSRRRRDTHSISACFESHRRGEGDN